MATFEITSPDGRKFEITAPEGATQEQVLAYAQSKFPQTKQPAKPETFAESVKAESKNFGTVDKLAIGLAGAVNDAAMRLKQMLGRELTPEEQQGIVANRALREESGAATVGDIAGNVAMTYAPAAAVTRGVATAAQTLPALARGALGIGADAAAGGAISAATQPVLSGESATDNAIRGAVGSAAGSAVARGIGGVITPTEPARRLMQEGVTPTPGQAAGGFLNRIEQSLQSVPIVGQFVRNARDRATDSMNVAAIRRALPQNARGEITEGGRQAIERTGQVLSEAYQDVLGRIPRVAPDMPFLRSVVQTARDPEIALTPEAQDRLIGLVRQAVVGRGEMNGEVAKRVDSVLGNWARQFRGSANGEDRALAQAIAEVQGNFRQLISRNAAPEDAQLLGELNRYYANYLRVQRAAGYVGANEGRFSGEQLQSAVRGLDASRNKAQFARGNALMQDLSEPAKSVLGSNVRDSGTPERLMTALMFGGAAAGGANEYYGGPGFLTAAALAPLAYSRYGVRALTGQIPGQEALGAGLLPYLTQIGRASAQ